MWKVFEDRDGHPWFLFHGLRGCRRVPVGRWVAAEVKWAREGSNPHYWTAFHCYRDRAAVAAWRRRCRKHRGRVAVEVQVAATRAKPTGGGAVLAERIYVDPTAWAQRIPLSEA